MKLLGNASFLVVVLLLFACTKQDSVCETINQTLEPTQEQKKRFYHLSNKKESFQVIQNGDTATGFVFLRMPEEGGKIFKCTATSDRCGCTNFLYYNKITIYPNSGNILYFIVYDYLYDSVHFTMPIGGYVSFAVKDLHNPQASTYIGDFTHRNKVYKDVHRVGANATYPFDAYVNDSVGLIYYKSTGNNYSAGRF